MSHVMSIDSLLFNLNVYLLWQVWPEEIKKMGNFFSTRENNSTSVTSVRLSTAHLTVFTPPPSPPPHIQSEIRNQLINKPRIWDMIDDWYRNNLTKI